MAKPAKKVRTEDEIRRDLMNEDMDRRQKAMIEDMKALEEKHQLRVTIRNQYLEAGIIPRFVLVDTKYEEKKKGEQGEEKVEETTEDATT